MKKNIIVFAIVIAGFFFFQHHFTPNIPLPAQYSTNGKSIEITARMELPTLDGESWNLAKRSDNVFMINVYNNGKLVHSFLTQKILKNSPAGATYGTDGTLLFNHEPYTALTIRINPAKKIAWITFTPAKPQPTENSTNS